jgi:excisionase family DNA binding protein
MKSGIFTVDQVAEMFGFHPKTVRRFIRERKLKARKIGGQWRIMEHDIKGFMGGETVERPETDSIKDVKGSRKGLNRKIQKKVRVSSIVDVFVENKEEALRISSTILAAMKSKDPAYGDARCDYLFDEHDMKARFILWGTPAFMSTMFSLISIISS